VASGALQALATQGPPASSRCDQCRAQRCRRAPCLCATERHKRSDELPERFGSVVPSRRIVRRRFAKWFRPSVSWSDRWLGQNRQVTITNDRLWMATGNNAAFGGDLARRLATVALNPPEANPYLRTDFKIENLDAWMLDTPVRRERRPRAFAVLRQDPRRFLTRRYRGFRGFLGFTYRHKRNDFNVTGSRAVNMGSG
jgi:hypothetical protein